ncbi:MAG: C40 family peptidase [Pelotomaculum sp.]|uniref:Hypothetical membrane protein n=1 Tax=Pelotomaculum thermopropionicum (strain DSM 13744 / JCM 10971 / SI) TaxID=370438 RepID=A5CYT9_PELTS|nr:C40 family peptidase [Pelotomaculum sp.]BAF60856.1 hypothetical membrane protein [Pelotomaculum thermopropionicum SI]
MKSMLKGSVLLVALAALFYLPHRMAAGPGFPGSPAPGGSSLSDGAGLTDRGAINVPLAVLWSEPGRKREHDELILRENGDPAAWAGGMDGSMRLWLVGKVETMAVYGEPVVILERSGDWLKVAVQTQKTSLNEKGYPGWVPAAQVAAESAVFLEELEKLPCVVVTGKSAPLYADAGLTKPLAMLCYQTRLPLLGESGRAVTVRLPGGGTGYLAPGDVKRADALAFTRDGIVNEARKFLGLPYLWGGTSSYGFDCSGFVMRLYQSQGISIPRDADEQATEGFAVEKDGLLPGDLVFYAAKGGSGQIHHVGMYIGNGLMIHSPNSSSAVRIEAIDGGDYGGEFWGARRYAP